MPVLRAPHQAERQFPSPESCYKPCEVRLPCDTQVLNCTRICTSDRKGEAGLDFGRAGLRLLDIPVSTYLARSVTSPVPISETSRTRTQFDQVFLNIASMLQGGCHKAGRLATGPARYDSSSTACYSACDIGADAILV